MKRIVRCYAIALVIALIIQRAVHGERRNYETGTSFRRIPIEEVTTAAQISFSDTWILFMYAPWCGHCKRFKPVWIEFAKKIAKIEAAASTGMVSSRVKLAQIDCDVGRDLCREFGVQKFPSIFTQKNGVPRTYVGPRDLDNLERLHIVLRSASVARLYHPGDLQQFQNEFSTLCVHFGDPVPSWFGNVALGLQGTRPLAFAMASKEMAGEWDARPGETMLKRGPHRIKFEYDDGDKHREDGSYETSGYVEKRFAKFVMTYAAQSLLPELGFENFQTIMFRCSVTILAVLDFEQLEDNDECAQTVTHVLVPHLTSSHVRGAWVNESKWAEFLDPILDGKTTRPAVLLLLEGGLRGHIFLTKSDINAFKINETIERLLSGTMWPNHVSLSSYLRYIWHTNLHRRRLQRYITAGGAIFLIAVLSYFMRLRKSGLCCVKRDKKKEH